MLADISSSVGSTRRWGGGSMTSSTLVIYLQHVFIHTEMLGWLLLPVFSNLKVVRTDSWCACLSALNVQRCYMLAEILQRLHIGHVKVCPNVYILIQIYINDCVVGNYAYMWHSLFSCCIQIMTLHYSLASNITGRVYVWWSVDTSDSHVDGCPIMDVRNSSN